MNTNKERGQPDNEDLITIVKRIDENTRPKKKAKPYQRKELIAFSNEMELYLKLHDTSKGDSWKECDLIFLKNKLQEEIQEWNDTGYSQELVDIANICMMLWNRIT